MAPVAIPRMHSRHVGSNGRYLMEGEVKAEEESVVDDQRCHDFQDELPERWRRQWQCATRIDEIKKGDGHPVPHNFVLEPKTASGRQTDLALTAELSVSECCHRPAATFEFPGLHVRVALLNSPFLCRRDPHVQNVVESHGKEKADTDDERFKRVVTKKRVFAQDGPQISGSRVQRRLAAPCRTE